MKYKTHKNLHWIEILVGYHCTLKVASPRTLSSENTVFRFKEKMGIFTKAKTTELQYTSHIHAYRHTTCLQVTHLQLSGSFLKLASKISCRHFVGLAFLLFGKTKKLHFLCNYSSTKWKRVKTYTCIIPMFHKFLDHCLLLVKLDIVLKWCGHGLVNSQLSDMFISQTSISVSHILFIQIAFICII